MAYTKKQFIYCFLNAHKLKASISNNSDTIKDIVKIIKTNLNPI